MLDNDCNVTVAPVALLCSGSSDFSYSDAIRRKSTTWSGLGSSFLASTVALSPQARSPSLASSSSCYRASASLYIGVIMSSRTAVLSFLSVVCLACILYYTIIPQGPQLLWYPESVSDVSTSSEMTTRAEKFTPEYARICAIYI